MNPERSLVGTCSISPEGQPSAYSLFKNIVPVKLLQGRGCRFSLFLTLLIGLRSIYYRNVCPCVIKWENMEKNIFFCCFILLNWLSENGCIWNFRPEKEICSKTSDLRHSDPQSLLLTWRVPQALCWALGRQGRRHSFVPETSRLRRREEFLSFQGLRSGERATRKYKA